jgi:lysophospholipid acyltransferase (LPLAT)-like uncharacterized protein
MPAIHSQTPDPRPQTRKSSAIVVPNSPTALQRFGAWVVWAACKFISATLRYRLHDPYSYLTRKDLGPVIYCLWHNRLALSMQLNSMLRRRQHQSAGLVGLVSASKDGAFLAAILQRFGVQPVRGSSSRRGGQALLELTTWTERGYDIAITPDGPRGPRYIVREGPMTLAQVTGLPIVPVSFHLDWKIQLKSWDRFQIPLPFSRCDITVGKTFLVPREIPEAKREHLRRELEAELLLISRG